MQSFGDNARRTLSRVSKKTRKDSPVEGQEAAKRTALAQQNSGRSTQDDLLTSSRSSWWDGRIGARRPSMSSGSHYSEDEADTEGTVESDAVADALLRKADSGPSQDITPTVTSD
jgi:hypothetical protein